MTRRNVCSARCINRGDAALFLARVSAGRRAVECAGAPLENETDSDVTHLHEQQRRRLAPVFYEVHHWPHEGRVLIVDKQAQRSRPILTWVQVAGTDGTSRADATVAVAYGLGAAVGFDIPGACVVLHDRHGTMLATPAGLGLPVTALRRAA